MNEFKVGDWVDFVGAFEGRRPQKIIKVEEIDVNGEPLAVFHLSIGFGDGFIKFLSKISLKLWQPKEGDWCWFYNSTIEKWYIEKWENSSSQRAALYHETCEPYIGELPSFLKDKR